MTSARIIPFRLSEAARSTALAAFAARPEIDWFGFRPRFSLDRAIIDIPHVHPGHLGGGGSDALNGGVIAAGFDAVSVLAALGHHETATVVTVSLSITFLRLASGQANLRFEAYAVASSRELLVVQGELVGGGSIFSSATAVLKPKM